MAAKVPKNVRFRPDQVAALASLQNEETDFSALVRIAVDRFLNERGTRSAETSGSYTVRKLERAAKALTKAKSVRPRKKSAA